MALTDRDTCARCHHPRLGAGAEGHYQGGQGPCKALDCACRQFLPPELLVR